jgi:hypothetical protein
MADTGRIRAKRPKEMDLLSLLGGSLQSCRISREVNRDFMVMFSAVCATYVWSDICATYMYVGAVDVSIIFE